MRIEDLDYEYEADNGPEWRWKHFTKNEISCRHCGELPEWTKDFEKAMDALEDLRHLWKRPIYLNSAHRCEKHNEEVGGVKNSQHRTIAFDCKMAKADQPAFIKLAEQCGFTGIGVYSNFVHLDTRKNKARW